MARAFESSLLKFSEKQRSGPAVDATSHDTSGPIITSPSHPQVGAQSRGASNEFIFLVFKISDDKPSFLESKD